MEYPNIRPAIFVDRPNRFLARIEIEGGVQLCHVKNTGRLKELLLPGANIFVQQTTNPRRKTAYSLIAVYKGERLVNIDSQVPNQVFHEWILTKDIFSPPFTVKPEYTYLNSRFDFCIGDAAGQHLIEVKGVTLEKQGVALFPDAPTERGVKHINELIKSLDAGYQAHLFFVIQMRGVTHFTPNAATHPAFARALETAQKRGVRLMAFDCRVTANAIIGEKEIPIVL